MNVYWLLPRFSVPTNYQYIIHSLLGPLCIRINSNEYSAQIFSVFFLLVALSQGSEMLFRYLKIF